MDTYGWAYSSIVDQVSRQLPQYRHEAVPMCEPGARELFEALEPVSDVIVAMFIQYVQVVKDKSKCAMMVTGFRPFEVEV